MLRVIVPIITSALRRLRPTPVVDAPAGSRPGGIGEVERRLADRTLADGLERAMDMGLWAHAHRIAASAERLRPKSIRLTERLVQLRLAEDAPETALRLINAARQTGETSTRLRLLEAASLSQSGRIDQAHSLLLRWSRRASAPRTTRIMLALLEWDAGDRHAAMLALLRNLRFTDDVRSLEVLLLLAASRSRDEQVERWAERLAGASAYAAGVSHQTLLLRSLGVPHVPAATTPMPREIDRLARELVRAEEIIPALVEAQRIRPRPDTAALLAPALEKALPRLAHQAVALEALARLALLRGERAAARNWVERGLARNPLSAPLAILKRAFIDDERAASGDGMTDTRRDILARIGLNAASSNDNDPSREQAA